MRIEVLDHQNSPATALVAISLTEVPTCFNVEANTKLEDLPSLEVYSPSADWSRSTPITQTLSASLRVSFSL